MLTHKEKLLLVDTDTPAIPISLQAELLGVSRSSIYYVPRADPDDLQAARALDELYTRFPFYGSRRLRLALNDYYGIAIGRDHVRRLMRLMELETIFPKKNTSKPHPGHKIYPYLLRNLAITKPNHVWGTDLTYIPLENGFCYLVAIIDWFSRYVLAWELSPTMETTFCARALRSALTRATPDIFNSDQGAQFTAEEFVSVLEATSAKISMDGRGRCLDNIFTERLWRTVKYEDIYLNQYRTIEETYDGLTKYFPFYNRERRHQSLGYKTPATIYLG